MAILFLLNLFWGTTGPLYAAPSKDSLKPRIIVLTDIAPNNVEPDDLESLIRLFAYADEFEIEGLIATTGWSNNGGNERPDLIRKAIDAYAKDLPNLRQRSGQTGFLGDESEQMIGYWPSPKYLRSRICVGSKTRGMKYIGDGNNSPGSDLIIKIADEDDKRPIWILAWGSANTLAQAIWWVKHNRSEPELKNFLHKLRVYTITDQDRSYKRGTPYDVSSHQWMREQFRKDLFFIWDESAWLFQSGTGKHNWGQYASHIQGHGNLGRLYPKYKYGVEGDSPSFLYLLPNGLNTPQHPDWVSWGGYFERTLSADGRTYAYTNYQAIRAYSISRRYELHFYPATFNDFAARMDWAERGSGNRNPVVIVNGKRGIGNIIVSLKQEASVVLNASDSYDPDGDKLAYSWYVLPEVGTYRGNIKISGTDTPRIMVEVPADMAGKTLHLICEVTDNGTPNLTSYRRIIISLTK
jgi:hypothetical protein